jgi:hypothetical protein
MTTHVVNDHVLEIPSNVQIIFNTGFPGAYDYLVYNDWEINTMEEGGFSVIDGNDWEIFATLEEAMKFIDQRTMVLERTL